MPALVESLVLVAPIAAWLLCAWLDVLTTAAAAPETLFAVAAVGTLIPRDVLFGNPDRISPRISPDGTRLAWIAPDQGVLNVWVRRIDEEQERVVTHDRERGIQEFFWAQDSRRIVYVQDRNGDENWHLWSVDLGADDLVRDLTPFLGVQATVLQDHPEHPGELLVLLNVRDRRLRDVYRLDLDTGGLVLEEENPGAAVGWVVDREFRVRGRVDAADDGGFVLLVRDDTNAPWRETVRWPHDEIGDVVGFTPDGAGMWLLDSRGRDTSALVRLDLASGEREVVAAEDRHDVGGASLHPVSHELELVSWVRERVVSRPLLDATERAWTAAARLDTGDMTLVSRDLQDRTWVLAFVRDDGPVHYYLFDTGSQQGRLLFVHRSQLEGLSLASMRPISFRARDGETIYGYLTLPPGVDERPLPLVLHPHGGPWVRDTWGFDPAVQWLANRGYAVLQVNFRGSTGYGKRFLHLGDKQWGRAMQDDLSDAVRWCIDDGVADPARVAIMGASYGGYAALAGATFTPELYAAAVDIVGPSNLFTLIGSIPPYWEPIKKKMLMQVGDPETEAELLRERSPLFHVESVRAPLLIGQGQNDPRVKPQESEQIVAALRDAGKEVVYVLYPDEGHGFARPENRLQFYAIAEEFLARHLGGRAEPVPEDEHGGSGLRR